MTAPLKPPEGPIGKCPPPLPLTPPPRPASPTLPLRFVSPLWKVFLITEGKRITAFGPKAPQVSHPAFAVARYAVRLCLMPRMVCEVP